MKYNVQKYLSIMFFVCFLCFSEGAEDVCIEKDFQSICYGMELSAVKQFEILARPLNGSLEIVSEIEKIHLFVLNICEWSLSGLDADKNYSYALSEVYSRIGWFDFLMGSSKRKYSPEVMLRKSLELNPDNPIAMYQLALILRKCDSEKNAGEIMALLRASTSLKPDFVEGYRYLLLNPCRALLTKEEVDTAMERMKHISSFSPQLYFFDEGYPAKNDSVYVNGDGCAVKLERKVSRTDWNRFKLGK